VEGQNCDQLPGATSDISEFFPSKNIKEGSLFTRTKILCFEYV
jgi:hypothetical protein